MLRTACTALLTASLAVPLAGCATSAAGDEAAITSETDLAREDAFRIDGVVVVERIRAGEGAQTSVSAKFMRHAAPRGAGPSSGPEAAERLVGTRLLLPRVGECASIAQLEEAEAESAAASTSLDGDVELVDVGDVALVTDLVMAQGSTPSVLDAALLDAALLDAAQRRSIVRLAPRAFPDVGDLVSGVFYTSPDASSPLPAPAHYAIESTGAAAVDKFVLQADAPAEPADVRVAGVALAELASEGVTVASRPVAQRGRDLLVSWRGAGDASKDAVYVDVQAEAGAVHRCTFDDTGEALLPAAIVEGSSIAIAVHRLRESAMPMPIDAMVENEAGAPDEAGRALVRFDLAVVGRVDVH